MNTTQPTLRQRRYWWEVGIIELANFLLKLVISAALVAITLGVLFEAAWMIFLANLVKRFNQ
jgi:hypothetical protein